MVEATIEEIKFSFLRDILSGLSFSMCSEGFKWNLYSISEEKVDSKKSQKRLLSQSPESLIFASTSNFWLQSWCKS